MFSGTLSKEKISMEPSRSVGQWQDIRCAGLRLWELPAVQWSKTVSRPSVGHVPVTPETGRGGGGSGAQGHPWLHSESQTGLLGTLS